MSIKYIVFITVLLLYGCVSKKNTKVDKLSEYEAWIIVYEQEIKIAREYDDMWAVYFFNTEIEQLRRSIQKLKKTPN